MTRWSSESEREIWLSGRKQDGKKRSRMWWSKEEQQTKPSTGKEIREEELEGIPANRNSRIRKPIRWDSGVFMLDVLRGWSEKTGGEWTRGMGI